MKFFHKILAIASLALLCTGCPSDPTGSHDSSTIQADGYTADGGSTDNDGTPLDNDSNGWSNVTLESTEGYVFIGAKTPDGLPADFYVCPGTCGSDTINQNPQLVPTATVAIYKNVSEIKVYTKANKDPLVGNPFAVRIIRQNYIFVDWGFRAVGSSNKLYATTYEQEKDNPWTTGSWGLAPNKTNCVDSRDGKKKTVSTTVQNGKVTMTSPFNAWITGHKFVETDFEPVENLKIDGVINPNLMVINFTLTLGNDTQEGTLTCQ